jgi:hypothetical protein
LHGSAAEIGENEEAVRPFQERGFLNTTEKLQISVRQRAALTPPPAAALLTSASTAAWLTMVMSPGTS